MKSRKSIRTSQIASSLRITNFILFTLLFTIFFSVQHNCYAQPVNNLPCNALSITCGESIIGTTAGANSSGLGDPVCVDYNYADVFYTFHALAGVEYSITINGSGYDGILVAYAGSCDSELVEITCADNGFSNGIAETVTFNLSYNSEVLIRTYDYNSTGSFFINMECEIENDYPCSAIPLLTDGSIFTTSNSGATYDQNEVIPPAGSSSCQSQDGWCPSDLALTSTVWFTFTAPSSGNVTISTCNEETAFNTQLALYAVEECGDYSTFNLVAANDDVLSCTQQYSSTISTCVNPDEIYFVQVDGYESSSGIFSISINEMPTSACIDCSELGLNVGDSCDDGNPETINDVITNTCQCIGHQACLTNFAFTTKTLDGTDIIDTISSCNFEEEYNIIQNVLEDENYIYTSTGGGGYITVRSGTFDGPVIAYGYSPLTVFAANNQPHFAHYTLNEYCETADACIITTVQCISCNFDCPELSSNIGDACDDGNPNTIDDMVDLNCNCIGTEQFTNLSGNANWNSDCGFREMEMQFYQIDTDILILSVSTFIDSNGNYDLTEIPVGTYDIYAKIEGYLTKAYDNQTISLGGTTLPLGTFIPGDLNDDNGINITDFSLLNISFGSNNGEENYNPNADMNCDEFINIIDVSILNVGFGQIGAQP